MWNFLRTALAVCSSSHFRSTAKALDKSQDDQSTPPRPSVSACVPTSSVTVLGLGVPWLAGETRGWPSAGWLSSVPEPSLTDEEDAWGSGGSSSNGTPLSSRGMSGSSSRVGGGAGAGAGARSCEGSRCTSSVSCLLGPSTRAEGRRELVVVVFCPLHVKVLQQDPVLDQCVTSDRRLECDCVMVSICADYLCSLDIGATLGPTVVVQRGVQLWDSLARSNHKSPELSDDWRS